MTDNVLRIYGGNIVTPEGTIENGTIVVENGVITEISRTNTGPRGPRDIDASGRWILPGMIDTHSDAIEHEMQPRPSSRFPIEWSFPELERKLVGQGITTMYHSLSMWDDGASNIARRNSSVTQYVQDIHRMNERPRLIRNRIISDSKLRIRMRFLSLNSFYRRGRLISCRLWTIHRDKDNTETWRFTSASLYSGSRRRKKKCCKSSKRERTGRRLASIRFNGWQTLPILQAFRWLHTTTIPSRSWISLHNGMLPSANSRWTYPWRLRPNGVGCTLSWERPMSCLANPTAIIFPLLKRSRKALWTFYAPIITRQRCCNPCSSCISLVMNYTKRSIWCR